MTSYCEDWSNRIHEIGKSYFFGLFRGFLLTSIYRLVVYSSAEQIMSVVYLLGCKEKDWGQPFRMRLLVNNHSH